MSAAPDMIPETAIKSPVAIGGLGGSGTRVVALLLSQFGYFLGDDVYGATLDNLSFTLLFKRPRWFYKHGGSSEALHPGLRIFEKTMVGGPLMSGREFSYLISAFSELFRFGQNQLGHGRGVWAIRRLKHILFTEEHMQSWHVGWGWKEPVSHLFMQPLSRYFADFKYIHVIRHALDMAYSKTQSDLYNWGPYFDIALPKSASTAPRAYLKFWLKANRKALDTGRKLGEDRFHQISFEQLCRDPKAEILKLAAFLHCEPDGNTRRQMAQAVITPKSIGRYKEHDIRQFDESDLAQLDALGYSI